MRTERAGLKKILLALWGPRCVKEGYVRGLKEWREDYPVRPERLYGIWMGGSRYGKSAYRMKESKMDNAHVIDYWRERMRLLQAAMFCSDGTLLSYDEYQRVQDDLFRRIQRETSFHG